MLTQTATNQRWYISAGDVCANSAIRGTRLHSFNEKPQPGRQPD